MIIILSLDAPKSILETGKTLKNPKKPQKTKKPNKNKKKQKNTRLFFYIKNPSFFQPCIKALYLVSTSEREPEIYELSVVQPRDRQDWIAGIRYGTGPGENNPDRARQGCGSAFISSGYSILG